MGAWRKKARKYYCAELCLTYVQNMITKTETLTKMECHIIRQNTLQVKEPYASNIYFRNYLQMSMELDNDNDNDIYFNLHKLI